MKRVPSGSPRARRRGGAGASSTKAVSEGSAAHFVGRSIELGVLEAAYAGKPAAFIPIYGRRRVGKTELILRFLRDKPALYHVGKLAPAPLQLRELCADAARLV